MRPGTRAPRRMPRMRNAETSTIAATIVSDELVKVRAPTSPCSPAAKRLLISNRSEEHTSELQSLMRISYAVFCLKKKKLIHIYCDKVMNQCNINHIVIPIRDTQ